MLGKYFLFFIKTVAIFCNKCFLNFICFLSQALFEKPFTDHGNLFIGASPSPWQYEWIGPGPQPSLKSMAQDKAACVHEAEQKVSRSAGEAWQTHVNLCMRTKDWGQKAID